MISIKRYLTHCEEAVPKQAVSLLLEKIASTAPAASEEEHTTFAAEIGSYRERIEGDSTTETILLTAGSAAKTIEAYNRSVSQFVRRQAREFQNAINMMTETVTAIAGENTRSGEKLREIGEGLERTTAMNDLAALKTHLGECLTAFRQETLRQKDQTDQLIATLRQEIEKGPRGPAPHKGEHDPATGLPTRAACLDAMHSSIPEGKRRYVVTLVVSRLQSINARFGYEVGDKVLCQFGEFIEQQILPQDRLFRWGGPTFVILSDRADTLEIIRGQIRRAMDHHLEGTFEVEGRSVFIPISATWSAFQLTTTVANAEKQIETFTATQGGREYL